MFTSAESALRDPLLDLPFKTGSPDDLSDLGFDTDYILDLDEIGWDQQSSLTSSPVPSDNSDQVPPEVSSNRKDWLVEDMVSKRSRAPRLIEFLVLLLRKPHCQAIASFTDRQKGIFQVHQPEKVAELWQSVKNRQSNSKMTYDKLARAIRWYYKSNLMQKTNTKYTFQFSPKVLKAYFIDENNNENLDLSDDSLFDDSS